MNIWEKLKSEKYLDICIIFLLILANVVLKSMYLTDYNIDLDEPFTLFRSQQNLKELFTIFSWENNPPLYFVILHFWIKLFGIGVVSARFLPMIISSLAVIFIFKTGNKFLNLKIAIGASLLYTFSNIIIMESHECRVYSLFMLLTTASMYFYFSLIESKKKKFYLIALIISNVLLIYSHFLAFFVVLLQSIFTLFITPVRKKILKEYLISFFFLSLSYLPYIYTFLMRVSKTLQVGIYKPDLKLSYAYHYYLETFGNGFWSGNIFLSILILFGLVLIVKRLKITVYEKMILGWFWVLYLLLIILSFKLQVLTTVKYLIFLIPGFCFSVMIAMNYLSKSNKIVNYVSLCFCIILMALTSDLNYSQGLESKKTVSYIMNHKTDSTLVYIAPPWIDVVFTYHSNINAFKDYKNFMKYLNDNNIFLISTANDIDRSKFSKASDVLLLDGWGCMAAVDPNNTIMQTLSTQFGNLESTVYYLGYTIYWFDSNIMEPIH